MEGLKPASQLKSGSVMDILGKGSLKSPTESITKPAAQLKSGTEHYQTVYTDPFFISLGLRQCDRAVSVRIGIGVGLSKKAVINVFNLMAYFHCRIRTHIPVLCRIFPLV